MLSFCAMVVCVQCAWWWPLWEIAKVHVVLCVGGVCGFADIGFCGSSSRGGMACASATACQRPSRQVSPTVVPSSHASTPLPTAACEDKVPVAPSPPVQPPVETAAPVVEQPAAAPAPAPAAGTDAPAASSSPRKASISSQLQMCLGELAAKDALIASIAAASFGTDVSQVSVPELPAACQRRSKNTGSSWEQLRACRAALAQREEVLSRLAALAFSTRA